jgi:hypothetical protein
MTFSLQEPASSSANTAFRFTPARPTFEQTVPKSIFASKTAWGIIFTAIAAIAPIVGADIDSHRLSGKDAAQIVVILCGAASALMGRVEASSPIYTPKCVPGPNKANFDPAQSKNIAP